MAKKPPKQLEEHLFKPGQSGNPNGRPRKLPHLDEILANVLGQEKEVNGEQITAAEAIIRSLLAQAAKGNIQAAKLLLERGYGLSKQTIDLKGDLQTGPKMDTSKLNAEEKRQLLELYRKAIPDAE
jgi:hypothetical protein